MKSEPIALFRFPKVKILFDMSRVRFQILGVGSGPWPLPYYKTYCKQTTITDFCDIILIACYEMEEDTCEI